MNTLGKLTFTYMSSCSFCHKIITNHWEIFDIVILCFKMDWSKFYSVLSHIHVLIYGTRSYPIKIIARYYLISAVINYVQTFLVCTINENFNCSFCNIVEKESCLGY